MNLCRPWPQGSRSGGVAEVADRVCCGGAYESLQPPPSVFKRTPNPTRAGEEQGGAASQEENDGMVAVARPQGTAPMPPSLFARRLLPYVGRVLREHYVREQLSPGFKTLARFDGKLRTIGRRGKCHDYTLKAPGSPAKWEAEARWSFCYMGGDQRDRRSYPRVQSSGGGASPHYIAGDI